MGVTDIILDFDRNNDILYVARAGINKTSIKNVEHTHWFVIKQDMVSGKIVGFIIHELSKRMPKFANLSDYVLMEEFDRFIDFINESHLASK